MTKNWKATLLIAVLAAAGAARAADCPRERPVRLPQWAISGAWKGNTLLLADAGASTILNYARGRGYLGEESSRLARFMALNPIGIKPLTDGWAVQFKRGRFIIADRNMQPTKSFNLFEESRREGSLVASAFNWTVSNGLMYSCSDYKEGDWNTGLLRIPLADPARHEVVRAFTLEHPMAVHCRLGYDLLATIGSNGYALIMDERPHIEVFPVGEWGRPTTFDIDLGPLPQIPDFTSHDAFAVTMRAVENAAMPVSLITWEGQLYVLRRRPAGGETVWSLMRVDPVWGTIEGEVELPSASPHLTVVPGGSYWAFIEKGTVRSLGEQDVEAIRYVPSELIAKSRSGKLCVEREQ